MAGLVEPYFREGLPESLKLFLVECVVERQGFGDALTGDFIKSVLHLVGQKSVFGFSRYLFFDFVLELEEFFLKHLLFVLQSLCLSYKIGEIVQRFEIESVRNLFLGKRCGFDRWDFALLGIEISEFTKGFALQHDRFGIFDFLGDGTVDLFFYLVVVLEYIFTFKEGFIDWRGKERYPQEQKEYDISHCVIVTDDCKYRLNSGFSR